MPSREEESRGLRIQWGESVRIAVRALAADKVKASLTMLGVVIGSAALVLVVTIGSTGKAYIVAQIEGIGADISYATLHRSDGFSVLDDELSPGDLAAVKQDLPGVRAAAGTYDLPVDFLLRGKQMHARLVGVTQDFGKIRNLRITSGRYFDEQDFSAHFRVCLVTDRLDQIAFGSDRAVGNIIPIEQFRCTIIGTFTEGVPTFGRSEIQDETVLIPFPLVKEITGDNFFQVLYAQATSSDEVEAMTRRMDQVLHSRHRKEARYSVENLSSLLDTANKISLALTAVLVAVAILTLVTAGTGIMNIMLVNVSQRTHEIGLRKALGAKPSEIRLQFLLEAFFISFTGAVVGVAAAIAIVLPVANVVRNVASLGISWVAVVVALVVSSGVGVLFGYRPARAAAELNPIDALRID
jgi:putative ABC transport system permease protein